MPARTVARDENSVFVDSDCGGVSANPEMGGFYVVVGGWIRVLGREPIVWRDYYCVVFQREVAAKAFAVFGGIYRPAAAVNVEQGGPLDADMASFVHAE